jgi:hypothetical protein
MQSKRLVAKLKVAAKENQTMSCWGGMVEAEKCSGAAS